MKKERKILCVVFIVLLLNVFTLANKNDIPFQRITIEHGLSQITVTCILQDKEGFMWFGTQDGLNKYDGYKFKVYQHIQNDSISLSNNYIISIFEDKSGFLWIGTNGGGLNKFNKKKERFQTYKHNPENPESISNNSVTSIIEDTEGFLWVGTKEGLNKFDPKMQTFIAYKYQADDPFSVSSNYISNIFEDSRGAIWISTIGGGLNKFNKNKNQFTSYQHQPGNIDSISDNNVIPIVEDTKGNLWIGTLNGLDQFDPKTEKFTRFRRSFNSGKNMILSLHGDTGDILWIGTSGGGLSKFDKKTKKFVDYQHQPYNLTSISDNTVISIYRDRGSNLWFGTFKGLNIFDRTTEVFANYQHQPDDSGSLSNNSISSILRDSKNNLWIGTFNGLNKFDKKKERFIHYKHQLNNPLSLSHNSVQSIFEDSNDELWIGTINGLNKFNRKKNSFTLYPGPIVDQRNLNYNLIQSIFEDTRGGFWIGTPNDLCKFDREKKTFSKFQTPSDDNISTLVNISEIFEDRENNLWIGTHGMGLNKLDLKEETLSNFRHQFDNPRSLSNNLITSILEDSSGYLWIGTNGGLNRFDKKKEFFTYSKKDGLLNDVILGILDDNKGNLWISTNKGISKFNLKNKNFTNYSREDGLQSDEFNEGAFYKDLSGKMYFGGINGFNEFDPTEIKDNTFIPPVVITDFLLLNKSVSIAKKGIKTDGFQLKQHINFTREITLNYTDYIFAFEFSALNYRQSKKNKYKYKMEGLDKDWIETDYNNRRATYTSLSHGDYVFRVKASNDDGYWNDEGTSVKVIILPPFWKTIWFKSVLILLILSIIIVLYYFRIKQIKQRIRFEYEVKNYCAKKKLTKTESEIALLIVKGKTNQEIEDILFISSGTIRNYISKIYKKLNIKNRIHFIKMFKNLG